PLHFARGMPANVIRGFLGASLFATPAYARLFAPRNESGPSGFRDAPRPFVLRAAHLDGVTVSRGEPFYVDVHLFLPGSEAADEVKNAFTRWARAELRDAAVEQVSIPLISPPASITKLRVRFLTPTELKSGAQIAARPGFSVLFARARDRVSTLRAVYGNGPLDIDFAGMAERAARVRMAACDVRHTSVERLSKGTGQRHPMGGFTGTATYEGEMAEFLPILRAAEWTGVGRQTVWGNGAIVLEG
ncbi:MAG: CRISPR system precrRNA processing endoribonuclease RAMP protein Cas6, partial [Bryobacteraceae bacterium]